MYIYIHIYVIDRGIYTYIYIYIHIYIEWGIYTYMHIYEWSESADWSAHLSGEIICFVSTQHPSSLRRPLLTSLKQMWSCVWCIFCFGTKSHFRPRLWTFFFGCPLPTFVGSPYLYDNAATMCPCQWGYYIACATRLHRHHQPQEGKFAFAAVLA